MSAIAFTVPGQPVAKGRPRATRRGVMYTPKATRDAETVVATCARNAMRAPLEGPLELMVTAYFKPAKSWSRAKVNLALGSPHTQRPDADNLLKLVLDALNGICFADDAQVARLSIAKRWAAEARTEIFIRECPL